MCSRLFGPAPQGAAFSFVVLFVIAGSGCNDVDRKTAVAFDTQPSAHPPREGSETGVDAGPDGWGGDAASDVGTEAETDREHHDTGSVPDRPVCGNGIREPGEECDDGNGGGTETGDESTGENDQTTDDHGASSEGDDESTDRCTPDCRSTAVSVALADDGDATLDIVVSPNASETVRAHAETLKTQLERITGATYAIVEGDGSTGLAVGVADHLAPSDAPDLNADSPFDREDFLVRTHERGLHLIGATELAVRHAVWDLLRRAGYRQYFPGEAWEIVPDRPDLTLAADEHESPAFVWRRLGFTYDSWSDNKKRLAAWRRKNRANGAFQLRAGHSWGAIIDANAETFDQHPEYLGEDDKGRPTRKLCVTRPAVQDMAIEWAIDWLEKRPEENSVPLDPSDGGGWDGCPGDDQQLGSPSNRAVFLANKVADGINAHFDEPTYVGMYAYNQHQWAPTISIHDRVIPNVATAFLERGNTPEQLIQSWSAAGAERLGIYEYYNVVDWSDDLPGEQRASSPKYVEESLRRFHKKGARFFNAETSDAWGPTGLGHWMAMRLMWEVDEHPNEMLRDDLRTDFLIRAFGKAREPIDEFYALLDRDHALFLSDHLVGRMYRVLQTALGKAKDPEVKTRIRELVLYTRYVDLFRDYEYAGPDRRQQRFEQLLRFAYRIHDTHMVHSMARFRRLADHDDAVSIPERAGWQVPEPENPWKRSKSFSARNIRQFLERGIADHPLRDFQPRSYSRDLVPAGPLALDRSKQGVIRARGARHDGLSRGERNRTFDEFHHAKSLRDRGTVSLYTWVPREASAPFSLEFSVSAENIHGSETGGQLPVRVFSPAANGQTDPLASVDIPVDRQVHRRSFQVSTPGLYRLDFAGKDRFFDIRMRNPSPQLQQTYEMSPDQWVQSTNLATYLFYVPEGTETIGGFAEPGVEEGDYLERPDGSEALDFADLERPGYFSVEVGEDEDGKLWRLVEVPSRKRLLMTVPPQVADSPDALLLPREVVRADGST